MAQPDQNPAASRLEGDECTDHPFHPVELKVNLLRPLASDGRLASAHGQLVHSGRRVAVGRGDVRDASGRTIAVATGSALLGEAAVGEH